MSKFNILWLQSGSCGGCSISLLNTETPDLFKLLSDANIELLWHPSISEKSCDYLMNLIKNILDGKMVLDALCIEGSIMQGPAGSGYFHILSGTGIPMMNWIKQLADKAHYTLAIGSCAAFGGINTAGNNPGDACGLQFNGAKSGALLGSNWRSTAKLPVINIAGCPTHPDWITDTLLLLSMGKINKDQLDEFNRPRFYTNYLTHHGCPRNEFYEFKASAEKPSDLGCLMENLGCVGTQARADCNLRLWHGGIGSCLKGGYACINCTAPQFGTQNNTFTETPKISGIPVGLPTDMPKAWFVALAALSKAATPKRLRDNAHAQNIIRTPGSRPESK